MPVSEEEFKTFCDSLTKEVKDAMNQEQQLECYGLFKQATEGDVTEDRPGMFALTAKSKWDARDKVRGMSKEDAREKYIQYMKQFT